MTTKRRPRFPAIRARDIGFFVAGVLCCFAVGGIIVRAVFNCAIDGTTFWTAVGSLAIIATALVAWEQLRSLNENERAKNTLTFVEKFGTDHVDELCIAIISFASGSNQNVRDVNFAIYQHEKRTADDMAEPERAMRAAQSYGNIADRYIKVHNYFTNILTLLERRLLDEDLFLSIMGQTIVDTNFAGGLVMAQVAADQHIDLSAVEALAKRAIKLQPSLRPTHTLVQIDSPDGGPPLEAQR